MVNVRVLCLVLSIGVLAAGCTTDRAARAEILDLRRRIERMREQARRDTRVIKELENRLFLLEDRLDTARVESGRKPDAVPRLPVVTKHAPAPAPAAATPPPAPAAPTVERSGIYGDDQVEIVYEGEAARDATRRPYLKLHESDRADDMVPVDQPRRPLSRRTEVRTEGYPDPAAVTDRIPVVPLPGKSAAPPPPREDPVTVYRAALDALRQRHEHAVAIAGFKTLLERHPRHDLADNAAYWLAEAYFDQRDYQKALTAFRDAVTTYPSGNKAPDSLLKVGYCYAKLGIVASARDVFNQVIEIYPRSEAARLAAARLEEMRE